jgi:hypothetical protein
MRKLNILVAVMVLPVLVVASSAQAATSRSAPSGSSGSSLCRVQVSRSAAAGVFDVTRQALDNGRCVCRVTTGQRGQGGSAEVALASLLLRRSCASAPLASAAAGGSGGLGGGFGSGVILIGGLGNSP